MKHLILALLLCFSMQVSAMTVGETITSLTSTDHNIQYGAQTYLSIVLKTLHDIDTYNTKKGRVRSVCLSDGTQITEMDAYMSSTLVWEGLANYILIKNDPQYLGQDITFAMIEYLETIETCGPTI